MRGLVLVLLPALASASPRLVTSTELDERLAALDARLETMPTPTAPSVMPGAFALTGLVGLSAMTVSLALLRDGTVHPTVGVSTALVSLLLGVGFEVAAALRAQSIQTEAATGKALEEERNAVLAARAAVLRERARRSEPTPAPAPPPEVPTTPTPPPLVPFEAPRRPLRPPPHVDRALGTPEHRLE